MSAPIGERIAWLFVVAASTLLLTAGVATAFMVAAEGNEAAVVLVSVLQIVPGLSGSVVGLVMARGTS